MAKAPYRMMFTFGDGGTTYVNVNAGKNVQHKYAEGNYTVKIVGG
jgi:PKD repeat protein